MPKYRKKPVEIEALRLCVTKETPCKFGVAKEYNTDEIAHFMGVTHLHCPTIPDGTPEGKFVVEIPTLEGVMQASIGDYIIKGVAGEFYPCKPEIFTATYELVE